MSAGVIRFHTVVRPKEMVVLRFIIPLSGNLLRKFNSFLKDFEATYCKCCFFSNNGIFDLHSTIVNPVRIRRQINFYAYSTPNFACSLFPGV